MLRPRRIAMVLAALAILLGVPSAAHLAGHPAARPDPGRQPVAAITLAARSPDVLPGGVCSVPGIGDILNLARLCNGGGLTGDLNNICQPAPPSPELANAGVDSLVKPVAAPGPHNGTLYDNYGTSGDFWAATNLQCSDMTSLIGNNVASMVFDIAKSIDRLIISVYQSAAGEGILSWLTSVVDKLISSLGNAIYFPYLAIVVILGAMWLAWQGLIRKRGTRTIEGTIWMVVACSAAIWLIGRPADFTGIGRSVSDGISQTLNVAFSKLPSPGQSNCLPVQRNDPQVKPVTYTYASGNGIVDQNANELWTVLVCKPWLDGEFGTTSFATSPGGLQTPVNAYGRQLLWAQAFAINEKPTTNLVHAKQAVYQGIASSIQQNDPGIYPLFQGKQWTTRLEIAFLALFAAAVAGVLVLLIAVTLILLKLSFLLLLVVGPFFLLIGTHPGFGRVVALRWFEMLVGVLLKQAAVALVLSVLLYAYSLIMGTSDAVLPWALKILMIALVTVAVFIYRRPFQHLFSAVGYGMIGSTERAEISLGRAGATARGNTVGAATVAVPGFAAYRAARWARRNPAQAASLGAAVGAAAGLGAAGAAAGGAAAGAAADAGADTDLADGRMIDEGVPGSSAGEGSRARGRSGLSARARGLAPSTGDSEGRTAPPLNLRSRQPGAPGSPGAANGSAANGSAAGAAAAGSVGRAAAVSGAAASSAAVPRRTPSPSAHQPSGHQPSGPASAAPPSPGASARAPRLPGPGFTNGHQPRSAGPTSAWPGASGRQSLGGTQPARPAGGPAAAPPASPPAAPPVRPAASPPAAPPIRSAGPPAAPPIRSAGPARPVPTAPPAPVRSAAAPSARPAAAAAARPARGASAWPGGGASPGTSGRAPGSTSGGPPGNASGGTSSGRQPAAAPPARHGGWVGPPDGSGPGPRSDGPVAPLAGPGETDQSDSPRPFWLRPLRRRK